jgi:uncharacterized protein YbjT (DUF2867 family)
MASPSLHIVTGAFGFSGRSIAEMLLTMGHRVCTLTNHPNDTDPLRSRIDVAPLDFADHEGLVKSLRGADVLYNTYWVRFEHGDTTYSRAVENSRALFSAAAEADVRRIVHVSITNPSADSPFPYFRGKAVVEQALTASGVSYAILRPAVLFGDKGILLNNIAWILRRLPVFGVFDNGDYGIQPVHVNDLAALVIKIGEGSDNMIVDAVGPETYTFIDLINLIQRYIDSHAAIVHVPPAVGLAAAKLLSFITRDVVLTRDEIGGLMANLLVSHDAPTCPTKLSDWLRENACTLGRTYQSELQRHFAR